MSAAWFNGFDVVIIDADGVPERLVSETLNVVKLPALTPIGTVTTDEFGHVAGAPAAATTGATVRFSHPDHPNTFDRVLAGNASLAAARLENIAFTFVAEDLTTNLRVPVAMEIMAQDLDNNTAQDQLIGYAAINAVSKFSLETINGRNLKFYANPVYEDGGRKFALHRNAASISAAAAAGGPPADGFITRALFAHTADAPSVNGGSDLYQGIIPGEVFNADGAAVRAVYSGIFAANGNSKFFNIFFDTLGIFADEVTQNGGSWQIDVNIIRNSSTTLKAVTRLTTTASYQTVGSDVEISALDPLDLSIPYILRLNGDCDVNGDFTARFGLAEKIASPADGELIYDVDDDGAFKVDDDGDYVAELG